MLDLELCQQLLSLDNGWSVASIELDPPSHRLDITIRHDTVKKKSLFRRSSENRPQETISLRHLPIAGYRTYLHIPKPGRNEINKRWSPAGSHFTNEMEAYIVEALKNCRSVTAAAKLAGITPAEAREVSERTGVGGDFEERAAATTTRLKAVPTPEPPEIPASRRPRPAKIENIDLPVETDPNWQRLINGEFPIQSSAVALQMLLQRIRQQIASNPSEVTRLSSARLLRQYFIKNQVQHPAEIAILTGKEAMPVAIPAVQDTSIPAETDPCWERMIDGELKIDTAEVGLQMMLERVRLSVERDPSESSRMAGVRALRQYFSKQQHRLQHELEQIGGRPRVATAITAATGTQQSIGIPAENHPSWLELVNGKLAIDTTVVALQMMLERVRLSVERNPSEASKQAGVKILRQFFQKYRDHLQNEIAQLTGTSLPREAFTTSTGRIVSVPAENNACWQSIINGQTLLDTDNVALQMMLERVRLTVERNPSAENITAGIKLLRQFFVKHQSRLQSELLQLAGKTTPDAEISRITAAEPQRNVPPESHPSWQRLINGELDLKTDVVALKMMLERIRISISNNPSEASRLAGAKILRQYFLKYQNKHQAEIDQLLAA